MMYLICDGQRVVVAGCPWEDGAEGEDGEELTSEPVTRSGLPTQAREMENHSGIHHRGTEALRKRDNIL